ncbi:hypothetical protein V8F20_012208 [Naviculisporaceae sp. PSN 640]
MSRNTLVTLNAALLQDEYRHVSTHPAFIEQLFLDLIYVEGYQCFWDLHTSLRKHLVLWLVKHPRKIPALKDKILRRQPGFFSRCHLDTDLKAKTEVQYNCLGILRVLPELGTPSSTDKQPWEPEAREMDQTNDKGDADLIGALCEVQNTFAEYEVLTASLQNSLLSLSELLNREDKPPNSQEVVDQEQGTSAAHPMKTDDPIPSLQKPGTSDATKRLRKRWSSIPPHIFYGTGTAEQGFTPLPSHSRFHNQKGATSDEPSMSTRDYSVSRANSGGQEVKV